MRRNAQVKARRFFPMCRQALFQKAPRQLYLANRLPFASTGAALFPQASQPGPGVGCARRSAARHPGTRAPGSRAGRSCAAPSDRPFPVPSILDHGSVAALGDIMIARCEPRDLGSHHDGTIGLNRRQKTGHASRVIGRDEDDVSARRADRSSNRHSIQHRSMASTKGKSASTVHAECSPRARNQRAGPQLHIHP